MFSLNKYSYKPNILYLVIAIFAVFLQIQISLFSAENYRGLRINLADIIIPVAGLGVIISLFLRRSQWPNFSMRNMPFWLIALIMVMSASLFNGYITNGFLDHWALVNKYIGFFLLLSYFGLGAWITTNIDNHTKALSFFALVFTSFLVLSITASTLALFLQSFIPAPLWIHAYPWDGFMANRNAFMIAFILAFCFIIWSYKNTDIQIPFWIRSLFWLNLPVFLLFNGSRTGWIIAFILAIAFMCRSPLKRLKYALPLLIAGIGILYASYNFTTHKVILKNKQYHYLIDAFSLEEQNGKKYKSNIDRRLTFEDGTEMYLSYDPLVGAGLGRYKHFQIEKRGEFIEIIDFTALWLLSETGLVGLTVFSAFFLLCASQLYKQGYRSEQPHAYYQVMFAFLILFAGMSILHELMYTRFLWFAMGLALAKPILKPNQ